MSERSGELRDQCANYALPSLPTYPSLPEEQNYSPSTPSERSSTREARSEVDGWPTLTTARAMLRQLDADRERSGYWRSRWAEDNSDQAIETWLRSLLDWLECAPQPLNSEPALGPVEGRGVAEIRGLCDAATPGPWSFYLGDLWAGATADELATADRLSAEHVFSDEAEDIFERASRLFHGDPVRPEDAAFIAAARDLVPQLLAEVEAAHRFERSVAVEREALLAEVEMCRRIRDEMQDVAGAAAAAKASAHVDLEAARAERDSLRGVVQAVEAERDALRSNVIDVIASFYDGAISNMNEFIRQLRAALAAAADAPQTELCGVEWVGCYAADLHYSCGEPKGHDGNHRGCPSPAVLPDRKEQHR